MNGLLTFCFLLLALSGFGADRYAVQGGSGTGCTVGTPCSITTAFSGASAGDTIHLDDSGGTFTLNVNTSVAGTLGSPITVQAKAANSPVWAATVTIDQPYYIFTGGIDVKYMEVQAGGDNAVIDGILFNTSPTVRKLRITADNCIVANNTFTNWNNGSGQEALWLDSPSANTLVYSNLFTDNEGHDCIRPYGTNQRIFKNTFENLITGSAAGNGDHSDILQVLSQSTGTQSTNIYFYENYIDSSPLQFANATNGGKSPNMGGWYIYNNVFINSRFQMNHYLPKLVFVNNSIVGNGSAGTGVKFYSDASLGTASDGEFKNNIILRAGGNEEADGVIQPLGDTVVDYNLITDATDTSFSSYSTPANSINGGYTPAQIFTDYANGDFSLVALSPPIDAGVDLSTYFTTDYNGDVRTGTWDMGALDDTGGTSDTTAPVISGVSVSPTETGATIAFTTDELAVSGVAYGTTASYGSTVTNTVDKTSHSIVLSGLSSSTTYHYKIFATDPSGNAATPTTDATFATAGSEPALLGYDPNTSVDFLLATNSTATATFSITNDIVSGDNLTWTVYTLDDHFSIVAPTNGTLVATASTNITVQFDSPATNGVFSGTVNITGGGGGAVGVNGISYTIQTTADLDATAATIIAGATEFLTVEDYIYAENSSTVPEDSPRAIIGFSLASGGTFHITGLANAADYSRDSFFINVDGLALNDTNHLWDVLPSTSGYEARKANLRTDGTAVTPGDFPATWTLEAGQHYIELRGREWETYLKTITITPTTPTSGAATVGGDLRVGF